MVYIASRNWAVRAGEAHALNTIDAYSNLPQVTLTVNGIDQGARKPDDIHKARWSVQLANGKNAIRVTGHSGNSTISDEMTIDYRAYDAKPAAPLSINVGSNAQYLDAPGTVWIEDREYKPGGFGHIGGNPGLFARGEIIKGTADQPLYYSYLDSLQGYRFDVKDGKYNVTLYFAESKDLLPGQRVFDVTINGQPVEHGLDLAASYGYAEAIKKTYIVEASDGQGIRIVFTAKKGNTLLSGIKIEQ